MNRFERFCDARLRYSAAFKAATVEMGAFRIAPGDDGVIVYRNGNPLMSLTVPEAKTLRGAIESLFSDEPGGSE